MKKLWLILKDHVQRDFHGPLYLSVLLFILINLTINFAFRLDQKYIRSINSYWEIIVRIIFNCWSYYIVVLLVHRFRKNNRLLSRSFLIFSFIGIVFHSINAGFPYLMPIVRSILSDHRLHGWVYKTGSNLEAFILCTLPLLFIGVHFIERDKREYLGLGKKADLKPYILLLLIVIPCIALAAFERGLGSYYPTYKSNSVAEVLHWPAWLPVVIYETAYALDFLNVEFFFRGFLVVGLSRLVGSDAIFPMVSAYCFLHFSKPLGEALSSIVGGYILGVLCYYTRNIWGGFILHVGVALAMELGAYLLKN